MQRAHLAGVVLLMTLLKTGVAVAASPGEVSLNASALQQNGVAALPDQWRLAPQPGRGSIEQPEFADPRLPRSSGNDWWTGEGRFQLKIHVAPELVNVPLALGLYPRGLSTAYLDGVEIGARGQTPEVARTNPSQKVPIPLLFTTPGTHTLTVHHRNELVDRFNEAGHIGGFQARIGTPEALTGFTVEGLTLAAMVLWLFTGIFLSFAALHSCLWLFRREETANLWFALLCTATASLVFFLYYKAIDESPRFALLSEPVMNTSGVLFGVFAVRFLYGIFYDRFPTIRFSIFAVCASGIIIWSLFTPYAALGAVFIFMLVSCLEMMRVAAVAVWKRKPGARLIGAGLFLLGLGFGLGLLRNMGVVPSAWIPGGNVVPFGSMVALIASMSLALSSSSARTNRELEKQLIEVERLSRERLEQERLAQQRETERLLLEAEVERKVHELEEARALQMSMLPASPPLSEDFEVATWIATATEVGGDYYDFQAKDGALIVAVGDATGHGMRAGTMVTATKALFGLVGTHEVSAALTAANGALRHMKLRRLAMAFTLARFEPSRLRIASAGMPPVLIKRGRTGEVINLDLEGIPLGAMGPSPYVPAEVDLAEGDLVLFMSDGFPELQNPAEEMFGYERLTELLSTCTARTAQQLVDVLVATSTAWKAERAADDDITFVAVRCLR